jgi:hypothetical protein
MAKIIYKNWEARVYPPLVAGAPPVVEAEPAAPAPRSRLPWWALLWYIAYASIVGGAYITFASGNANTTQPDWWVDILLAWLVALALWGVTLRIYTMGRKHV